MNWLSIIYFFVVTLSTGTLIDLLVREWEGDWLEKLVMRFGVGLSALSVIGVILNPLHIPLDYRVFLGIGILICIGALARNRHLRSVKLVDINTALSQFWKRRTFWYTLFMLVLFGITAKMYIGGTFNYDYLEDTDPWRYTVVADYIGEHKTFTVPYHSIQYSEPYTQGYQIVMGVLSQTNDSIYWTMKFFSTLIISFSILFMYYFARRFSRDDEVAVLAGFFLFAVPAWVTHFIYSNHYNMTIFVVLLYVLAQLMPDGRKASALPTGSGNGATIEPDAKGVPREDRPQPSLRVVDGWMYVGIVVYASMLINHFSTVMHGTIFCFAAIVTRICSERKIDWKTIMVFPGGLLLSLAFYIPSYARHWYMTEDKQMLGGVSKLFPVVHFVATPLGLSTVIFVLFVLFVIFWSRKYWQQPLEGLLDVGNRGLFIWLGGLVLVLIILLQPVRISYSLGTDDKWFSAYKFKHYFYSGWQNRYHNPIGLGLVLMSAVLGSFALAAARIVKLFKPENTWMAVCLAWIITAFILVLGENFSIAIIPFRAWTFLGFFASLFGAWGIVTFVRLFTKNYLVLLGVMVLLAVIITPTSFLPKYVLNTMIWEDYKIGKPESRALFAWMRDGGIPKNSVVAHLCGDSEFLSGYDMDPPVWNEAFHPIFKKNPYFMAHPLKITPEAYTVLKNANVEYVTVGTSCLWQTYKQQKKSMPDLLPQAFAEYMQDSRLTLIKSTGYEFLFKLN